MILSPTSLEGVLVVEPERHADERGFFARTYCREEFLAHGLQAVDLQCSVSFNARSGTLRGMHFQRAPYGEPKLVRVTQGAIFDVVVDVRPDSATYCQWFGIELGSENRLSLYIPEGFAHGFQTLEDNTEVFYQIGAPFVAEAASGVRWNDPRFAIKWPRDVSCISQRDANYPDFQA